MFRWNSLISNENCETVTVVPMVLVVLILEHGGCVETKKKLFNKHTHTLSLLFLCINFTLVTNTRRLIDYSFSFIVLMYELTYHIHLYRIVLLVEFCWQNTTSEFVVIDCVVCVRNGKQYRKMYNKMDSEVFSLLYLCIFFFSPSGTKTNSTFRAERFSVTQFHDTFRGLYVNFGNQVFSDLIFRYID